MTDVPGDDAPGKDRESSDEFLECATCGERFDPSVWHPATTTVDDDGEFQLLAFCSAECRDDRVTG